MGRKYVTVDVNPVAVYLDDFDTQDLLAELEGRGFDDVRSDHRPLLNKMYEKFTTGQNIDAELRELFATTIGRLA